jgi:hypothetical protein
LGYGGEFEGGGWKIFISLARRRFPLEKRLNVVVEICRLSACLTAIINRKSWTCALLGMAGCTMHDTTHDKTPLSIRARGTGSRSQQYFGFLKRLLLLHP